MTQITRFNLILKPVGLASLKPMTPQVPKLRRSGIIGICRPDGAEIIFELWFYKDAAPDGATVGRAVLCPPNVQTQRPARTE